MDRLYSVKKMMIHLYVTVNVAVGRNSMSVGEAIDSWSTDRIESPEDGVRILEVVVHNVHKEVSIHDAINQLIGIGVRLV
jgi:hypothetical protein